MKIRGVSTPVTFAVILLGMLLASSPTTASFSLSVSASLSGARVQPSGLAAGVSHLGQRFAGWVRSHLP